MRVIIQWEVKPDRVGEELALLAAMYEELDQVRPAGLQYDTYRLDDEVSFIAYSEMPDGLGVLGGLPAFQRYRSTLDDRCESLPRVTRLHAAGTYTSLPLLPGN